MGDLPVPELIEGALRFGALRSFLGRIVSLLGFRRRLPSPRPEAERSWFPIVVCATEGTVSVSTVMFRKGASVRDLTVWSDEYEGLDVGPLGRCVEADWCSCILALFRALLSLPFSTGLVLALRSSVIFDVVTSLIRSSSAVVDATELESTLWRVSTTGKAEEKLSL